MACNKTPIQVAIACKKAEDLLRLTLGNNLGPNYEHTQLLDDNPYIPAEAVNTLLDHDFDFGNVIDLPVRGNKLFITAKDVVALYFGFAKLVLPDLEYTVTDSYLEEMTPFNVGYGLFGQW